MKKLLIIGFVMMVLTACGHSSDPAAIVPPAASAKGAHLVCMDANTISETACNGILKKSALMIAGIVGTGTVIKNYIGQGIQYQTSLFQTAWFIADVTNFDAAPRVVIGYSRPSTTDGYIFNVCADGAGNCGYYLDGPFTIGPGETIHYGLGYGLTSDFVKAGIGTTSYYRMDFYDVTGLNPLPTTETDWMDYFASHEASESGVVSVTIHN